ncbi:hypothetical protein A3Q56_03841 [Intoshia linei]|uniref:Uncharacterized protein n=1 Tax=Intoshia linei TaxID=1819745 RepID=A0A177B484_9BILA|nr:hypothetical protein A3Q56_03841 [Intoshia linei]
METVMFESSATIMLYVGFWEIYGTHIYPTFSNCMSNLLNIRIVYNSKLKRHIVYTFKKDENNIKLVYAINHTDRCELSTTKFVHYVDVFASTFGFLFLTKLQGINFFDTIKSIIIKLREDSKISNVIESSFVSNITENKKTLEKDQPEYIRNLLKNCC